MNVLLVYLGLAVLSITLNMIASNIHHQMQKASFIEKLKDTELSESSFVSSAVRVGDEENGNGNGSRGRRGSGDDSAIATQDTNGNTAGTQSKSWPKTDGDERPLLLPYMPMGIMGSE